MSYYKDPHVFNSALFINMQATPKTEAIDTTSSPFSPTIFLSKDLLNKIEETSPMVGVLNDKTFTLALDAFLQDNPPQKSINQLSLFQGKTNKPKVTVPNVNNNQTMFKKGKVFKERAGDWVCFKCNNLNFSFRVICNRCKIDKSESEKLNRDYLKSVINKMGNK